MSQPGRHRAVAIALVVAFAMALPALVPHGPRVVTTTRPGPASRDAGTGPPVLATATFDDLVALPGIGPTLARRILEARDAGGSLRTPDDLARIRGVGVRRANRLASAIRWPPDTTDAGVTGTR